MLSAKKRRNMLLPREHLLSELWDIVLHYLQVPVRHLPTPTKRLRQVKFLSVCSPHLAVANRSHVDVYCYVQHAMRIYVAGDIYGIVATGDGLFVANRVGAWLFNWEGQRTKRLFEGPCQQLFFLGPSVYRDESLLVSAAKGENS